MNAARRTKKELALYATKRRREGRRRLSSFAKVWADWEATPIDDWADFVPTAGDCIAYLAGWAPAPRIDIFSILKRLYPQKTYHEAAYAENPFMKMISKVDIL